MVNKKFIPTTTNHRNKFDIQLFSPSKTKNDNFGNVITIIDCHTFYLKNFKKNDREYIINHFNYYIEFCNEYQNDLTKVLVLPDWDFITDIKIANELNEKWHSVINPSCKNILRTNSTAYNSNITYIGYASGVNDCEDQYTWKHIFSKGDLDFNCDFLTYDSMDMTNFNLDDNTITATFIQDLLRRE